ncbi:MAG TPA: aminoglycoside phosphotransferase family protein [Deinococcales bacterium]|nr:aminoglycoside phosphotransferase family protein [Deinococcales bacterium]
MELPRPPAAPLTVSALPAGVRSLLADDPRLEEPPRQGRTSRVAFALDAGGDAVAIKRSTGAHLEQIRREHRALRALLPRDVPAPEPLMFVERSGPSGPEGWLVTRRLPGTPLQEVLAAERDPARRASLLASLGAALAELHVTPPPPAFLGRDWLDDLLALSRRLDPSVGAARLERLRSLRPALAAPALVHGGPFLDNVLVEGGRVTGLVDWAFAGAGEPRYDLAVAQHGLAPFERDAFAGGYGPAALLSAEEEALFVEVAFLF